VKESIKEKEEGGLLLCKIKQVSQREKEDGAREDWGEEDVEEDGQ